MFYIHVTTCCHHTFLLHIVHSFSRTAYTRSVSPATSNVANHNKGDLETQRVFRQASKILLRENIRKYFFASLFELHIDAIFTKAIAMFAHTWVSCATGYSLSSGSTCVSCAKVSANYAPCGMFICHMFCAPHVSCAAGFLHYTHRRVHLPHDVCLHPLSVHVGLHSTR